MYSNSREQSRLGKLFEALLDEKNFATNSGLHGKYSKISNDDASPDLRGYDDDLAHKDMLPWSDEDFAAFDKDTNNAAWNKASTLAKDVDSSIASIVNDLKDMYPTMQVKNRIKSEGSARRKASNKDVGWRGLDDMVGYAMIFDTFEDCEDAMDDLSGDPRIGRVYDYADDDELNYYAYHLALKGGVGSEIQIISLRLYIFKELFAHRLYEVFREINQYVDEHEGDKDAERALAVAKKMIADAYKEQRDLEGTSTKIDIPTSVLELSDEDAGLLEQFVAKTTKVRFEMLLEGDVDPVTEARTSPALEGLDFKGLI